MYKDLYGEIHFEPVDIAKRLIDDAATSPLFTIHEECGGSSNTEIHIYNDDNERVTFSKTRGLYAIFSDDGKECLYVGQTGNSIQNRLYRFDKETKGKSRPDEAHPAAAKAREDGIISLNGKKVKYFPLFKIIEDVVKVDPNYINSYDEAEVDVYVAKMLKSKYNTVVKRG